MKQYHFNRTRDMEAETISKNAASPKSQMNKGNITNDRKAV
jgi:hypothetical protein